MEHVLSDFDCKIATGVCLHPNASAPTFNNQVIKIHLLWNIFKMYDYCF